MDKPPAAKDVGRPLILLARFGYAARGVIYLIIAVIAALALFNGKQLEGSRGALANLNSVPGGIAALLVVGVGLLAYAGWRLVQCFMDPDRHGRDSKGLVIRGSMLISAAANTLLALYALAAVWTGAVSSGSGSGSGSGGKEGWARWLMSQPWGRWVLAAVGAAVIAAGVAQFVKAVKRGYLKHLRISDLGAAWASPLCMTGLIARSVVFLIIGALVMLGAYYTDPDKAKGLAGALRVLREQPYGLWLLGAMALGLLAFAAYCFIQAGWRRIGPAA